MFVFVHFFFGNCMFCIAAAFFHEHSFPKPSNNARRKVLNMDGNFRVKRPLHLFYEEVS